MKKKMEFDSPYQSYEYMAKMEKYFREKIAKEIEDLLDPPPIDEVDHIVWKVIEKCADVARGNKWAKSERKAIVVNVAIGPRIARP